jgi:DNA-binding MarR family transcriptional regulator
MKGIWIPAEIWNLMIIGEISVREVQLLSIIKNLEDSEQNCFASNEYFAKVLNVRKNYISRMIANLKSKGFIEQVKFDGRRRQMKTLIVPDGDRTLTINQESEHHKEGDSAYHKQCNAELHNRARRPLTTLKVDNKVYTATSGFGFSQDQIPNDCDSFDFECCDKLQKTLPPKKRKQSIPKTWPNQFRLIREQDQIEKDEIQKVLNWYAENWKDKWTPKCYTAKAFREKFQRIKDAIERKEPNQKLEIQISSEAESITNRLLSKNWKANQNDNLSGCVQMSLKRYEGFRQQLNQALSHVNSQSVSERSEKLKNNRFKALLNHVIQSLPQTNHFVEQWFESVWNRLNNWDGWNGRLESFIFKVDSQQFQNQLAQIFEQYGRSSTELEEFMKRVNTNESYQT